MIKKNRKIKIYFIGIGGIGMSGIAELMHKIGYTVTGSDKVENENVNQPYCDISIIKVSHGRKLGKTHKKTNKHT